MHAYTVMVDAVDAQKSRAMFDADVGLARRVSTYVRRHAVFHAYFQKVAAVLAGLVDVCEGAEGGCEDDVFRGAEVGGCGGEEEEGGEEEGGKEGRMEGREERGS